MANNSIFNKIQLRKPKSNWFDLSHDHKTTFNMGELIPHHVQEVIPGDVFKINSKNLIRLSPLVSPAMTRVKVYTSYFFVPNRILWDKWEDFITGGEDPSEFIAPPVIPTDGSVNFSVGQLGDYMGLPINYSLGIGNETAVSALPFAAYYRIWYDYYRDQNLQQEEYPKLTNGPQDSDVWAKIEKLQRRAWKRDYLTAALPFAQKGEAVTIPVDGIITGTSDVYLNSGTTNMSVRNTTGTHISGTLASTTTGDLRAGSTPAVIDPEGRLSVDGDGFDLSEINTTINDLRTAYSLQKWLEKNARAGTRYIESLRANFFTSPTDARLQRPEMIGTNVQNVIISEVLQTSSSDDVTPQGNMAGHGVSASKDGYFNYTAQEHGFIIGLVSVIPEAAYADGIAKMWSRYDKLSYYWPDFAQLGEQAVLGKEVHVSETGNPIVDAERNTSTFGYMPRYAEYRFQNSLTTGQFRPTQSLAHWTLTRAFNRSNAPLLNAGFIVCRPSKRIFAVEDPAEPAIICHIYNDVKAKRLMPKYGNPGW